VQFSEQLAPGRFVHPVGAAELLDGRQADVYLGADRCGDLGAQILADGAAGDAAEHLAEDEPVRGHVVTLCCARLPPGFGDSQLATDVVPIAELLGGHPGAWPDHAGAVTHHHRQRDVFLTGLPELGPIPGHRGLQVQFAAIGELMHAGGRQALGPGKDSGEGVLLPGPRAGAVGPAAPQVDNQIAVDPYRHGRADLATQLKVALERVANSDVVRRA
jgi:hypothetical protein